MSATRPTREGQEHLDAVVAFASSERRRRALQNSRHLHSRVGHRRYFRRVSIPPQHEAHDLED